MLTVALLTLIHVLVFVYWLGGDLGAFYSSRYLTRPGVSTDTRLFAAKIVGDVDMAPRTALVLAFPTGLVLAEYTGWVAIGWLATGLLSLSFAGWLVLVWRLHLLHDQSTAFLKSLDLGLRWVAVAALFAILVATLSGYLEWPLFVALKCAILAVAILLGLYIRRVLSPLGPALAGLKGETPSDAEALLAGTLNRARPLVALIWVCLIAAALIGLWKPA